MRARCDGLALSLACGLLLSACGSDAADGPGSVSVDEAQALDEAAEMLEERRLPDGALPLEVPASDNPAQDEAASGESGEEAGGEAGGEMSE